MASGGFAHNPNLYAGNDSKGNGNEDKTADQWLQEGRDAYYIYNDKKKARECYNNTIKQDNHDAVVTAEEFFLDVTPDSAPSANVLLYQSLQRGPNAVANYLSADFRFRRGEKEEALKAMESGNKLKSEDIFSVFHKAWVTAKWISPDEGLNLFNQVIAKGPGYCRFYSEKAQLLLTRGDHEEALKCSEEALKINPYFVPALLQKADLMRAQGDEECVRFYNKILAQEANHNKALFNKSMACYEFEEYEDGIATMKLVLQQNPNNKALNVDMGDFYYETADYETAIDYYNKGDDGNARKLNNKGLALAKLGKLEESIQNFEKAVLLSQNPLFYCNRGKVHIMLKEDKLALECFDKATFELKTRRSEYSINQKNIDFINATLDKERKILVERLNKAHISDAEAAKKADASNEVVAKFIKLWKTTTNDGGFANNPNLFVGKAAITTSQPKEKTDEQWLQEGREAFYIYYDKKKATQCYENANKTSNQQSLAISIAENYFVGRDEPAKSNAMLVGSLGHAETAIALYLQFDFFQQRNSAQYIPEYMTKLNKLKIEDAFSLFHKALYTAKWEKSDEALGIFDRAIKLAPGYCLFYSEKAELLSKMKNTDAALSCLEEALKINPFFVPALLLKGILLRAQGNEGCIGCYTKIIIQDFTHRKALINKSMACYEFRSYEEGITTMKIVLRQTPNDKALNIDMGDLYYEIGDYETAITYYDKGQDNQARNLNNRALALIKLERYEEAIDGFDKAIRLSCNPLFLCNKGKVHIMLGQDDMALECFDRAAFEAKKKNQEYPLNQRNLEFINATLENDREMLVERLNGLQQATVKVNKLSKKLDPSSRAAKRLIKRVKGLRDEKATITNKVLDKLNSSPTQKDVNQIVNQNKMLADQASALEKRLLEMGEQIASLQKNQKTQGELLAKHEEALTLGGVYTKAEITKAFDDLDDRDPQLHTYCKTFYWTAINLFGAYRNLSTGLLNGNADSTSDTQEEYLVAGAQKVAGFASQIAQGIPFVGGLIGALDSIIGSVYSSVKDNRFQNRISTINLVIQNKFKQEEDISNGIAMVALAMTRLREQAILNPEVQPFNKFEQQLQWLQDKINAVQQTVLTSVDLVDEDSAPATLALEDVTLFMSYLYKNHALVNQNKAPLDVQCSDIFKNDGLNDMLGNANMKADDDKNNNTTAQNKSANINGEDTNRNNNADAPNRTDIITVEGGEAGNRTGCSCALF